jgi:hydroxymethylpyrimidine/phosphomethylpyrimidine kinase
MEFNKELLEKNLAKYNFFNAAPHNIVYIGFLIAIIMALIPNLIPAEKTLLIIPFIIVSVIIISFTIYSFFMESVLKKKIIKLVNSQDILIKNVKEAKILKTNDKIHEAEITFENGEIETLELIIIKGDGLSNDVLEYKKIPKSISKNRYFTNEIPKGKLILKNNEKIVLSTTTIT